jgi:hypothetical protein
MKVRQERFRAATEAAAALIRRGYIVYSPITMTHPIDLILAGDLETLGSQYWVSFDEAFMEACSEILVLQVDGWSESVGIRREIEHFVVAKPMLTATAKSRRMKSSRIVALWLITGSRSGTIL